MPFVTMRRRSRGRFFRARYLVLALGIVMLTPKLDLPVPHLTAFLDAVGLAQTKTG